MLGTPEVSLWRAELALAAAGDTWRCMQAGPTERKMARTWLSPPVHQCSAEEVACAFSREVVWRYLGRCPSEAPKGRKLVVVCMSGREMRARPLPGTSPSKQEALQTRVLAASACMLGQDAVQAGEFTSGAGMLRRELGAMSSSTQAIRRVPEVTVEVCGSWLAVPIPAMEMLTCSVDTPCWRVVTWRAPGAEGLPASYRVVPEVRAQCRREKRLCNLRTSWAPSR